MIIAHTFADFVYNDFSDAAGIQFNGDAGISACGDGTSYNYFKLAGINDEPDMGSDGMTLSEGTAETRAVVRDTETRNATVAFADVDERIRFVPAFPSRGAFGTDTKLPCPPRLRLTPSRPSRTGSTFRREAVSLLNGFDTGFTFQITDVSRACTHVRDRQLSARTYQVCYTQGGDGFAFVLQLGANFSRALGGGDSGLGYAGLTNTVAVEFDTWYNAQESFDDLMYDHIAVQVSPPGGAGVTPDRASRISMVHAVDIGDGQPHAARVTYFPYIKFDLLPFMDVAAPGHAFMLDAGENRRIGTLAVYVDNFTSPLLAVLINLNVALTLPEDQVFVGFTAATGASWQKHDILDWYFCESPRCTALQGDSALLKYRPAP